MSAALRQAARTVLAAILFGLVAGLLLVPMLAGAQTMCPTKPTCDPVTTKDRRECGAELKGKTATGEWRAFWFPITKTSTRWEWCPFKWAMLDKYSPSDPRAIVAIVDALKDAPDVPGAIMQAMTEKSVKPAAGSQDAYEFDMLHFAACEALLANPPTTFTAPLPQPCKRPTAPPAEQWKAIGGTIFTYANGKLTGVTNRKAAKDAPAVCVPSMAVVGTRIFCQLVGGPLNEVAEAVK